MFRVAASAAILSAATGAARAGEGESALSGSLGWATYATPGKDGMTAHPSIGGVAAITYERGISEALSWRVSVAGGGFAGDGGSGAGWLAGGLVYRFDVLKYVPYALVGVGGIGLGGGPLPGGFDPLLELGGGLDVLSSRDRSWGVEARLGSFAGNTTIFTIGVRRTWRWGYF
ncbi:MAG: hypothetical protein K8W52_18960 [Deltaproteobacteria bacterium]|nr:hypothetical protein [Deltaproteobacteria bacterium]